MTVASQSFISIMLKDKIDLDVLVVVITCSIQTVNEYTTSKLHCAIRHCLVNNTFSEVVNILSLHHWHQYYQIIIGNHCCSHASL